MLPLCFPAVTSLGSACGRGGGGLAAFAVARGEAAAAERAAAIFYESGFVVLRGVLGSEQVTSVHDACECLRRAVAQRDPAGQGNRNPGRYSMGAVAVPGQLFHLEALTMGLVANDFVLDVLDSIFPPSAEKAGEPEYVVSGLGGDFCLGTTPHFQKIHSDIGLARPLAPHQGSPTKGPIHNRRHAPHVSVNYCAQALTRWNGPMRIVPWSEMLAFGAGRLAPELQEELDEVPHWLTSKLFPLSAGDAIVRDVRVWHGGCPNMSGAPRFLPAMEVMSTAYFAFHQQRQLQCAKGPNKSKGKGKGKGGNRHARPTLPETLFERLPARAQRRCAAVVARPSAENEVNDHVDDVGWIKPHIVQEPRDCYWLQAAARLEEATWPVELARLATLDDLALCAAPSSNGRLATLRRHLAALAGWPLARHGPPGDPPAALAAARSREDRRGRWRKRKPSAEGDAERPDDAQRPCVLDPSGAPATSPLAPAAAEVLELAARLPADGAAGGGAAGAAAAGDAEASDTEAALAGAAARLARLLEAALPPA